jgi:membrane-bound lytic murein transglycosylase D
LPGIKITGPNLKRLSVALAALLSSHQAVAEAPPANAWSLGWGEAIDHRPAAPQPAPAPAANEPAANESAAEAAPEPPAPLAGTPSEPAAETVTEAGEDGVWQRLRSGFVRDTPDATATATDDVWQRIRNGFAVDEAAFRNPLVGVHESWFADRPENVLRLVERARPYLFHIVEELDRRAMPMEIALLPMIESAFNPTALSPASASGIWQFMPATGRHYGLRQDNWYDGRGDFAAATRAALDYLNKLYLDFGDWQLALAAYNCGEGCVSRAIRRNAEEGLPTDYASLQLPNETRHYVPRLLALSKLIHTPEDYGLEFEALPNRPYFDRVTLHSSMDVHSAARLANMSSDEFIALNAAFPRKLIYCDTPVSLLLPVDKVDTFQKNLSAGTWETWKPYVAKKGERPATLAKRLGVSASRLAEHNQFHLKRGKFVRNQTILVPVKKRDVQQAERPTTSASRHLVQRGDTLYSVAMRYGVSVSQLTASNPKLSTHLKVGEVVRLPTDASAAKDDAAESARPQAGSRKPARPLRYTVKRGDTLGVIARRFDLSLAEIRALNPGFRKTSAVRTGQTLVVRKP